MIDHQATTPHLTRREALAAERQTHPHSRAHMARPTKAFSRARSDSSNAVRPAARTAVLPLVGAAAALLLFTVNTTPAIAAASVTTAARP